MAEFDRITAQAMVEAGYMPLREYIERFGEEVSEEAHRNFSLNYPYLATNFGYKRSSFRTVLSYKERPRYQLRLRLGKLRA